MDAGPLWSKNADAAAYAYVAQNNMSLDGSLPDARRIPLAGGCVAVISYDASNETANIAFSVSVVTQSQSIEPYILANASGMGRESCMVHLCCPAGSTFPSWECVSSDCSIVLVHCD